MLFLSFGSNNLLNYDKQHNNNNIPPWKKKVAISHTKNHYSTSLIIIFLLNKI